MQVNDALLHNWFYGNYGVRFAAALIFGFLMGSIPVGPIARWLFAELDPRLLRVATALAVPLTMLKGAVPTLVALHGGGLLVGLGAGLATVLGHYFCPWRGFRGGDQIDAQTGVLAALSPPSALVYLAFWSVAARTSGSAPVGAAFASALLFLPLWYFLGAPAGLFGVAAGTALALRLWARGQPLERVEIHDLDRSAAARRDQPALL